MAVSAFGAPPASAGGGSDARALRQQIETPTTTLTPTPTELPTDAPTPTDTPASPDTPTPTETPTETPAPSDTPTATEAPTAAEVPISAYPAFFRAFPDRDSIDGGNWPLDAVVHLTIDDPATSPSPDHEQDATVISSPWDPNSTYVSFDFANVFDLKEGDVAILTAGVISRQQVVPHLSVTNVDLAADTVAGSAGAGVSVHVFIGPSQMFVTADAAGAWLADFSALFDIVPGTSGGAEVWDEDGDSTIVDWSVPVPPNPRFTVFPEWEFLDAYDWPDGVPVTASVDGKPECSAIGTSSGGFFNLGFPEGCDVQAGNVVTLTDEVTTRTHLIRNLSITSVDPFADIVAGAADPGEVVNVWPHETGEQVAVTADASGAWQVDFSGTFDLVPGTAGRSEIRDEVGNGTAVDWYVPSPWLTAFPEWDFVEGFEWPMGAVVDMAIDDPDTEASPDLERQDTAEPSPWGDPRSYVSYDLAGQYDLKVGDEVTLTDGVTNRTLVVENLSITSVDEAANTVKGTADAGEVVNVWPHETGQQVAVTADADGMWQVDLTGAYDIVPGSAGRAEIRDDFYNGTAVDWSVPPSPRFTAFPEWEFVEGWDWLLDALVHLTIDDPATPATPDYEQDETVGYAPWDPNTIYVSFEFAGAYDMKPGDIVTLTDGETERVHVVRNLSVTRIDVDADTVAGMADEGEVVNVWPHETGEQVAVTADADGMWQVGFTGAYDIVPGSAGRAEIRDQAGNATALDWYVPNPWLTAFPEWEFVEGWEWPMAAVVHLAIDDPATQASPDLERDDIAEPTPWGDPRSYVSFELAGEYDVKPGDVITLSDGATVRTHVVRNLSITAVDEVDDSVAGIADPGAVVNVWPHETGQQVAVTADADGMWQGDLTGAYDIVPGSAGRAEIRDEAGNGTAVDWYVPNPILVVQITDNWFEARDFAPGAEVAFSIYDAPQGTLLWGPVVKTVDQDGLAFVDWWEHGLDLVPGNYLVASNRDIVLEPITFDLLDLMSGHMQGTAPSGPDGRLVWIALGFVDWLWSTEVMADAEGNWSAEFGGPVPLNFEWVAAQVFDEDGDASEVRPSQIEGDVNIDVLPLNELNSVNCRFTWLPLPVAVLSDEGFDATALDHETVRFGHTGTEAAVFRVAGKGLQYAMDVNSDGLLDMVYHFRFGDTGFSCSDIPAGEPSVRVEAFLSGQLGQIRLLGTDFLTLLRSSGSGGR